MEIKQAKAKAVSENPFYGLKALLTLNKYYEKVTDDTTGIGMLNGLLNEAWKEAVQTKNEDAIKLFFVIVFAGGDIANREHNMFGKIKVDQGGQAKRKAFRFSLNWILVNQRDYFYKFLPIIAEYTNYENLFYNQIRTDRHKGTLASVEKLPVSPAIIAEYLKVKLLDDTTSEFERGLIAKFLPKVPQAKRWRKDKDGKSVAHAKKSHTLSKDATNLELIKAISSALSLEVIPYEKMTRYRGYEQLRSKYLALTEAHLFSSQKIRDFDATQFIAWLEGLPAGARYRVQCRLLIKEGTTLKSKGKWSLKTGQDMGVLYQDWMLNKEIAMQKLVSLTEEEKQGMNKEELKTLQKTATVTTGASTIYDTFIDLYKSSKGGYAAKDITAENAVKLQTLVDKVKLDVPVMVTVDASGSMGGGVSASGVSIDRIDAAKLFTAIMLYKNPSADLASTFMTFSSNSHVFSDGTRANAIGSRNRFTTPTSTPVQIEKIADKQKPFVDTLRKVDSLFQAGGYTDFSTVADLLKGWVDEDPEDKARRIEVIQGYPVWVMISDGDLNSAGSPGGSMDQFKMKMKQWFGAEPVIVVWDIIMDSTGNTNYFENIDNVVHLAGVNPGIINQLFYNIDDLDVIDIYIQLNTLFKSNRYEPVKVLAGAEQPAHAEA